MARYTESVCRICRREGTKLFLKGDRCFTDKCAVTRRAYAPGQHGQGRRKLSEYGTQLRMNGSIQAEGSFAVVKEDMNFRRYLYRGKENVLAQSVLLAIAYNINKLHFKIQGGRTGQYLTELKAS